MTVDRAGFIEAMAHELFAVEWDGHARWDQMSEDDHSYWRTASSRTLDAALAYRPTCGTCHDCTTYTVDVVLHGVEPYRCIVCERWRQAHDSPCPVCHGTPSTVQLAFVEEYGVIEDIDEVVDEGAWHTVGSLHIGNDNGLFVRPIGTHLFRLLDQETPT